MPPGSRVLYLGAASGTTVSHVADMVGPVSIQGVRATCPRGRACCTWAPTTVSHVADMVGPVSIQGVRATCPRGRACCTWEPTTVSHVADMVGPVSIQGVRATCPGVARAVPGSPPPSAT
ncbi:fibrillarin domain-containing protein [Phthorimaea operculella]|nr:fibrillarin domain-containing protein [Phthorimaea operculella]